MMGWGIVSIRGVALLDESRVCGILHPGVRVRAGVVVYWHDHAEIRGRLLCGTGRAVSRRVGAWRCGPR